MEDLFARYNAELANGLGNFGVAGDCDGEQVLRRSSARAWHLCEC